MFSVVPYLLRQRSKRLAVRSGNRDDDQTAVGTAAAPAGVGGKIPARANGVAGACLAYQRGPRRRTHRVARIERVGVERRVTELFAPAENHFHALLRQLRSLRQSFAV